MADPAADTVGPPVFLGRGGNVVAASDNWVGSLAGLTLQAGDLLIANIAYRDSVPFTVPAGWSLVAQESQGNTSATNTTAIASGIMAYIVRGEENPDLTFTRTGGSVAQGRVQAFRGVDPANPFIGGVSATMAANGTIVQTTAGLTTARDNALIVIGACNAVNGSSVAADMKALDDPQTGWTERCDDSTAVSPTTQQAFGDAIKAAAGDTGILQWRNSATTRAVIIAAAFNPMPEPVTSSQGAGHHITEAQVLWHWERIEELERERDRLAEERGKIEVEVSAERLKDDLDTTIFREISAISKETALISREIAGKEALISELTAKIEAVLEEIELYRRQVNDLLAVLLLAIN